MQDEERAAVYDRELGIEAYRLRRAARSFPNHFHAFYVFGLIEARTRVIRCKNREYQAGPGTIVLLCPGDSHACVPKGGEALDYRGFNIAPEVLRDWTGGEPVFYRNTVQDGGAAACFRAVHEAVMGRGTGPETRARWQFLLSRLLEESRGESESELGWCEELERACAYMESHYGERVRLEEICRCSGLSKSGLLRTFVRTKGITPYAYLEAVRVDRARKLLEQGASPAEAALKTGFSDQSHFTNVFSRLTSIPPGAYRNIFRGGR